MLTLSRIAVFAACSACQNHSKFFSKFFFPTYGIPMATLFDLRNADSDSLLKTQLIQLCKDSGLPTSGLKSSLVARLLTLRSQLPPLPASSAATVVVEMI